MTKNKFTRKATWIPLIIVAAWLGLAAIGGPYFGKISEVSSNDMSTFLPQSAESTAVNEQLPKFRDSDTIPAIIVFEAKNKITPKEDKQITAATKAIEDTSYIDEKIPPAVQSEDGKAAFIIAPLSKDSEPKEALPKLREAIADTNTDLTYKFTGPASFSEDLGEAFGAIDGLLLVVALAVVFIILLAIYRSPILPIISLLGAVLALAGAIFVVWHMANAEIVQMNGQVQGILFILVIGAATDYALLYISRFREEIATRPNKWEATKATWKASWEPIVAAGGTVTLGLLCLLASDLGSNRSLGPVGGLGVIFAIISALTFLPSVLLLLGKYAFWPKLPKPSATAEDHNYRDNHPFWKKIGDFVGKYPRRLWIGLSVILLIACLFIPQLKVDGVAQSDLVIGESEARDGQALLDKHFPSGSGSPVLILANPQNKDQIVKLLDQEKGVEDVSYVSNSSDGTPVPVGKADKALRQKLTAKVEESLANRRTKLANSIEQQMTGAPATAVNQAVKQALSQLPSAKQIVDNEVYPFKDSSPKIVDDRILLQATLKDPASSIEARQTVAQLRDDIQPKFSETKFGGVSAIQLDTNTTSERDLMVIIPLILLAVTAVLMLLLRSIVAPLLLMLTTIVSFGSTLGIAALVFNHIWQFPGGDPAVVIFGFVFLVALGIDYNIFLMSRVREETAKIGVKRGTIKALIVTGGVITSAGIVLASTFAALFVIPILFLVQIAFIVAFGVLLDTIIVRSLIVPGLTLDIGRKIWWPSKLAKSKDK